MRKLLNLYAANRGKGAPLAVSAMGDDVTLEVYDVIVSSEADAAWLGGVAADTFCREMRKATAGQTVHVRVNSPGGDVFAGVAMAQAIRECAASVVVHVDGYAASAASLLVAAADNSVIAPGGMVMIHQAWTIGMGNADDFIETSALLEKIDGQLAAMYQAKAGGTPEEWLDRMKVETWFTGQEAVAAGLVTSVAETAPKVKADFDLSVYARAPVVEPETERVAEEAATAPEDEAAAAVVAADIERRRRIARAYAPTAA